MVTFGQDGTGASLRGDDGPVVRIHDTKNLIMPDWRGNNRIESPRNIVEDGRISLMFMVSGIKGVVSVNGYSRLNTDETLRKSCTQGGQSQKVVIEIFAQEVYLQCPKSFVQSKL